MESAPPPWLHVVATGGVAKSEGSVTIYLKVETIQQKRIPDFEKANTIHQIGMKISQNVRMICQPGVTIFQKVKEIYQKVAKISQLEIRI